VTDHTGVLGEVERCCGAAAALRLAHRLGGTRIYVPKRPAEDHHIADAVGMDVLSALSRAYGGEALIIPMASAALAELRRQTILTWRAGGQSIDQITSALRVGRRWVFAVLAQGDARSSPPRDGREERASRGRHEAASTAPQSLAARASV
jgi:Mor family transcriptional regulator